METTTPTIQKEKTRLTGLAVAPASPIMQTLGFPQEEPFEYRFALYGLNDGHYLYRCRDEHARILSKFVTAADAKAAFSRAETDSGWIDPGIVRCGYGPKGSWFVQYVPMQRFEIALAGIGRLTIPTPPLVLVGCGRTYRVFATKAKRFSPDAILCAAPFPNVGNQDGAVCWGDNTPPQASPQAPMQVWKLFFDAPFSDHTIQQKSRKYPDDIRCMLLALSGRGARTYPMGDLVPIHSYRGTVERILHDLLRGD